MLTQLDEWFTTIANERIHATVKAKPAHLFTADRSAMRPPSPYPPVFGVRPAVRLPRKAGETLKPGAVMDAAGDVGHVCAAKSTRGFSVSVGSVGE